MANHTPLAKRTVVHALLSEGLPHQSIADSVGICRNTVSKISKEEIILSEHAEKVKRGLRNRFAVIANKALDQISDEKLSEASAKDLMYVAVKATDAAKVAEPSITETYTKSMERFLLPDGEESVKVTEQHTVTRPRASAGAGGEGEGAPLGGSDASA